MARIKYNNELIHFMSIFEHVTRTKVKDVIVGERILYIVSPGQISKAIGKKGANVRLLEQKLKKKVKFVEFSDDVAQFVQNLIYPINPQKISAADDEVIIEDKETKTKALLIGRNSRNLAFLNSTVKRYFDIKQIKVI
jgi:NusA-like KH domain protein